MSAHGLLNLNKPAGFTSRQCVSRIARLVRPAKVGHAGTLDPLATGVLVICVGDATRLIQYVQRQPKSYTATFLLGRTSDTEDIEGQVLELDRPPIPSRAEIVAASQPLRGTIRQRPPAFSALRVQGRRAYKLARMGVPVELAPRTIDVYELEIVAYQYPELTLRIRCGSGTYVRSLGRDLAASLGTGAVMSELTRTAIGDFRLENASPESELGSLEDLRRLLQPPLAAVAVLPRVRLSDDQLAAVRQGQLIRQVGAIEAPTLQAPAREFPETHPVELAALTPDGHLAAILTCREPGVWAPSCVLAGKGGSETTGS
jgi:tRNA pseudouridine55 synthase